MAVTTPVALTVATAGVPLLQTPDAVALASAVVEPIQTLVVPVMFATTGSGLTIMEVDKLVSLIHALLSVTLILYLPETFAVNVEFFAPVMG